MTDTHIHTPYEDLLQDILDNGTRQEDRTGTGTLSVFGRQMRYNLSDYFPLITTKKVAWKSVVGELLWFLRGDTNIRWLKERNISIWDEWADDDGSLGAVYGSSWRAYPVVSYGDFIQVPIVIHSDADVESSRQIDVEKVTEDAHMYLKDHPEYHKEHDLWFTMIQICYAQSNTYDLTHKNYTVHPRWHDFKNFLEDIPTVPGYAQWSQGVPLKLDPEYHGSTMFSPQTCVFIEKEISYPHNNTILDIQGTRYADIHEYIVTGNTYTPDLHITPVSAQPGYTWRRKRYVDQIDELVTQLKENPHSRRHLVVSWNVSELSRMNLPPCHTLFQFYVADGKLSCQLYQRSADMFLGVPFNIASYALLTHIIAQEVGLDVGEFIWTGGDCHIYVNHIEQVKEQLSREPYEYPQLEINRKDTMYSYDIDDFNVVDYKHHPAIKGEVSV